MHKNKIWLSFLIAISLVTASYLGIAAYQLTIYLQLSARAPLQTFTTSLIEDSESNFHVDVDYSFIAKKKVFQGKSRSSQHHLINRWAAEQAEIEFIKSPPKVWYNPNNPDSSSLVKVFPLSDLIYSISLLALLVYFILLGLKVGRLTPQ